MKCTENFAQNSTICMPYVGQILIKDIPLFRKIYRMLSGKNATHND